MTAIGSADNTYLATYPIPLDSSWIGRKVAVTFGTEMEGFDVGATREIEIVGSPAQVIINNITDASIPTITADVRITNEGSAAYEYTYEYCIVQSVTNECGGNDDIAYGSAAKLIQPGVNFDTYLTLNLNQAGSYYFKLAVWWSNESSKSSKAFTALAQSTSVGGSSGGGSGGGSGLSTGIVSGPTGIPSAPSLIEQQYLIRLDQAAELFRRIVELERRVDQLDKIEKEKPKQTPIPTKVQKKPVPQKPPAPKSKSIPKVKPAPKVKPKLKPVPKPAPKPILPKKAPVKPKITAKKAFPIRLR